MDYLVRRSMLAEANIRRPQEFFARVYAHLLEKYARFLADSNNLEVLAQCERSVARHCRGATHRLSVAALPFAGNNTQECQGQFVEFPLIRAFLEQPLFETVQDALSRASKTCQYMGFIA
ncbi:MAG: hypothetical protein HUK04_03265 [Bacteroidaceae bacterium]|nr:hypothetical protein [Bacteroidaceae bacterium]